MKTNAAFLLGRDFARRYPDSVDALGDYQNDSINDCLDATTTGEGDRARDNPVFPDSGHIPLKSDQSIPTPSAPTSAQTPDPDTRKAQYHTSSRSSQRTNHDTTRKASRYHFLNGVQTN